MSLEITLVLLTLCAGLLGYAVWRVRQRYDVARPPLIDWHYVMFPSILATGLLALHALMLWRGR